MEMFKAPLKCIKTRELSLTYKACHLNLLRKMPRVRISIYLEYKLLKCLGLILWNATQEDRKKHDLFPILLTAGSKEGQ